MRVAIRWHQQETMQYMTSTSRRCVEICICANIWSRGFTYKTNFVYWFLIIQIQEKMTDVGETTCGAIDNTL